MRKTPLFFLLSLFLAVGALNDALFVSFQKSNGSIDITSPTIIVDADDYTGVHIAATALTKDFQLVTSTKARLVNATTAVKVSGAAVIVGSLQSKLIKQLVSAGKLDVSSVEGKWESFVTTVVQQPFPGVQAALVIAGSDKRGTIFGAYTLSEEIGVSPWYWWADVVPKRHSSIHALPVQTNHGEPSVKFRGIFLNDEAPALTSFVLEKFGPVYNSEFYKRVFELLLRMKANYIWPAMWPGYPEPGNSFFVDDPLNQKTADDYGVVVSTSHHEPMQRATNEWLTSGNGSWDWTKNQQNVTQFFIGGAERARGYESYFTIGMRGAGDSGVVGDDPAAIIKQVIATQRTAIASVYGNDTAVRQVWPLYKEVQALYEQGFDIPEDVTLMFADDNYGSIRRLPTATERTRAGGIGVYYHLEYVGSPRSYKWMNTNSLGKIQQQFSAAHEGGINQIWVINVGDLKPMETPLSLIMAMAWNASSVTAATIPSFLQTYSAREFPENYATEIADLLLGYSRLLGLKRHEPTESSTFSILNYNEAELFLSNWTSLLSRAEELNTKLTSSVRPSFFQLVLHPIKASHTFFSLKIAQAKNTQYATQRRNSANDLASDVLKFFGQDYDIQEEYHSILNGKWDNIMRQAHYGITTSFNSPSRDMISGISYVQMRQPSVPAIGQMGVSIEDNAGVRPGLFNEGSDKSKPSRGDLLPGFTLPAVYPYGRTFTWFEVFGRGPTNIQWSTSADASWVSLSPTKGTLSKSRGWDQRIQVTVDWNSVPDGYNATTLIHVNANDGSYEDVHLPVIKTQIPGSFKGFIEGDGYVAIEAAHFTSSTTGNGVAYQTFPYLSRTLAGPGAVGLAPSTAISSIPDGPYLDYTYYQFSDLSAVNVSLYFTTALDTDPATPRTFAISLDSSTPVVTRLMPAPATVGDLPAGWATAVVDMVWMRSVVLASGKGAHTLRYWAGTAGVLLERIVVNLGGVRTSYLGPPESRRV